MATTEPFDAVEVIRLKRDGEVLPAVMIDWVIDAYTRGVVTDYQMSALAMAIFLRGMNRTEISQWTQAMLNSGERMDLGSLPKPTADKHSTGGIGDKITLPLAPLVACFDVAVPQLSGRGLAYTGGTLDKLESIPGWQANLSNQQIHEQLVAGPGAVVCAAGAGLAPADKQLYALRDVTATVDCVPLIASSIMSKKIAEGTSALVLDVKVGSGAFMKDLAEAQTLARTMVDLGRDAGMEVSAFLTDMSMPLGMTVGNALEVREAVEVLQGAGPADVVELTVALATEMLRLVGIEGEDAAAPLRDGRAYQKWCEMIRAQGGDPEARLPEAAHRQELRAEESGYVQKMDALGIGMASWRLGVGRSRQDEPVQAGAGIELVAKPGTWVEDGDLLLVMHTDEAERFERAEQALAGSILIGATAPKLPQSVILGRVD